MHRGILQIQLVPIEAQIFLHPADIGIVDVGLVEILDDFVLPNGQKNEMLAKVT